MPKKRVVDWEALRHQYGCGPVTFSGADNSLFERHLLFDYTTDPMRAEPRQQFEALALVGARRALAALGEDRARARRARTRSASITCRWNSSSAARWSTMS
ncbi:MAG: hypothetical protein MZW92_64885 [Comamonadaceae bacterium]|nr:hypothetical protein [Comamonadaceae bacterium]